MRSPEPRALMACANFIGRLPSKDDKHSNDYHWLRQDDNGKWSHKPGGGKATNKDWDGRGWNGNEISDPETANLGRYKKFCGYCCVCPEKVEVASLSPREGEVFATVTLREPAILASRGMELDLPPGRLSLIYGEVKAMLIEKPSVVAYVQIFSGRQNPHLDLSTEQQEILRAKLNNLPARETEPPSGFGYHGFLIHNPEKVAGLPIKVRVFDGAVAVWDGEARRLYEDVNQLERWLLTLACASSFGHDVELALEETFSQKS